MSKSDSLRYVLIIFMLGTIGVMFGSAVYMGAVVGSDQVIITHDNVFSGSDNNINVQTNLSVSDVKIYLNETLINHSIYELQTTQSKGPSDLYSAIGTSNGNLEDLNSKDGLGMIFDAKHKKYWHFSDYYYSEVYAVFDTSILRELNGATLRVNLNSTDKFLSKISHFDFHSSTWKHINVEMVDNSEIDLNVNLNSSLLSSPSLRLRFTGYNSKDDFNYLLDQLSVEYLIPDEFEDNYNIDVSLFVDGPYILKVETLDFTFTKFTNESVITVDNTAPIINIIDFPSLDSNHNDTDILRFEANIEDVSETETILQFELNGSDYMTIDFGDSKSISYMNTFLPGLYDYDLITVDSNGLTSHYSGNFTVEYYEAPPIIIIEQNQISISVPSVVNEQTNDYPVLIELDGSINNEYLCNLTINDVEISSGTLFTNNSLILIGNTFNQSINLKIYNINDNTGRSK